MLRLVLITVCSTACNADVLSAACGRPCYPEAKSSRAGIGACTLGTWTCDDGRVHCEGYGEATEERCDGIDNDCNGKVDEDTGSVKATKLGVDNPCPRVYGVCANAGAFCLQGALHCDFPSNYEGEEISCDGLDNDCDGWVDEDLFSGDYCYTGPIGTELNPPCHPGALACEAGEIACVNEQLPQAEVCNGLDDDCDGEVDEDLSGLPADIVVMVDRSGSMSQELPAVAAALDAYEGCPNCLFALVDITDSIAKEPVLALDLSPLADVQNMLLSWAADGHWTEYTTTAQAWACQENGGFYISWRQDSMRALFGFSDEPTQSKGHTKEQARAACLSIGAYGFWWVVHTDSYLPLVQGIGAVFPLSTDPNVILYDLEQIQVSQCL